MLIRNWRNVPPRVSHQSAIIWDLMYADGTPGKDAVSAPLGAVGSLTLHAMQSGQEGDYHDHDDDEQIYYFTRGKAKMKIDGDIYDVREGDAVLLPPKTKHQLINDSDDWVEHLIVGANVRRS